MTRKAFLVDEAMREKVRYLAGVGVRQDDIAQIIGCAPKTLRKRFRAELDRGVAEANAAVCGYLFAAAKAGNISAIIFWLKTRAHWREGAMPDAPPPRAEAEENSQVLLVLPDNSRDPGLTQVLQEAQQDYFARSSRGSVTGTPELRRRAKRANRRSRTMPPSPCVRAAMARLPSRRGYDACRPYPDPRSRRSPDRRSRFCRALPTSASMAARQGAERRLG